MFYNARMYDPALGRFISADSIVPGGVQGLDRYAYVNNSPIMYTDPSGHKCAEGIFAHEECESGGGFNAPTPRPNDLSDDPGDKTGISGNDFYTWYLDLFNEPDGWWWDMFGQDSDGFTIWDAFAVIYIHETQGNWADPNLSEAAIRDANSWCIYMSGQSCTTGGYINHFAHEYQSAGNYVGGLPPEPGYVRWNNEALKGMQNLSSSFANHPTDWNNGCVWASPCGWGNKSLYSQDVQNVLAANQSAVFTYYDPNGDTWIIPSQCVIVKWMGGGVPSAVNLNASCPNVR